MPGLMQSVRTEWERTAFSVAWGLVATALVAWAWWLLQEDRPVASPPPPAPPIPVLNRETAFAFLGERVGADLRGLNLFNCPIPAARLLPKPPASVIVEPTTPPVAPAGGELTVKPAVPALTAVAAPTTSVRPTRTLLYQGCITTPSGVSLAFLQDCTGQTAAYVRAGQALGGVTVKKFDGQRLILTDAAGKDVEIMFGAQREVTAE